MIESTSSLRMVADLVNLGALLLYDNNTTAMPLEIVTALSATASAYRIADIVEGVSAGVSGDALSLVNILDIPYAARQVEGLGYLIPSLPDLGRAAQKTRSIR